METEIKTSKSVIGKQIEINELQQFSKGIVIKALKGLEAKGNKFATYILEGKRPYDLDDLQQSVIERILIDNMIITKKAFQVVGKTISDFTREKNRLVIIENENEDEDEDENSIFDKNVYIEYLNLFGEVTEKTVNFKIDELGLTKRQLEIIKIYGKLQGYGETAKTLGISRSTVQTTIDRLRKKLDYLIVNIA